MFEFLIPYIEIILPLSAIIAIMLFLVPVMNKRYVARARYFVWLVIAIRLLLPFDINFSKEPVYLINAPIHDYAIHRTDVIEYNKQVLQQQQQQSYTPQLSQPENTGENTIVSMPEGSDMTVAMEKPLLADFPVIRLQTVVEYLWVLGTILVLAFNCLQYIIAKIKLKNNSIPYEKAQLTLDWLCTGLKIKRPLVVYRCSGITSAMIVGIFSPVIYIPDIEISDSVLEMMLRHELMHYKRRDILYKFVLLLACCVHWFNPLVWLMDRQSQKDIEIACDEDVIKDKSKDFKSAYSDSIISMVKMGATRKLAFSTGFANDKKTLVQRFRNIYDNSIKRSGKAVTAVILALTLLSTMLISCARVEGMPFEVTDQAMDFMRFYCNYRESDNYYEKDGYDLGFGYLFEHNLLKDEYIHSYFKDGSIESYRLPMAAMMDVYQFLLVDEMPQEWWAEIPELKAMSWASDYNSFNSPYVLEIKQAKYTEKDTVSVTLTRTRYGVPADDIQFILQQQTVEYVPNDLSGIYTVGEKIWRIKSVDIKEGSWRPESETAVEIYTVEDFIRFTEDYNANGYNRINYTYKLMNDIDFGGMELTPIGGTTTATTFAAQFDGQGHTLSNFKITYDMNNGDGNVKKVGLFASIGRDKNDYRVAEIRNLNIDDAEVKPIEEELESMVQSVGILVGEINNGYISNCHISGYVEGRVNVGGLVGYRSNGYIDNCITDVQVKGNAEIGSLAGTLHASNVVSCESRGTVTGYACEYPQRFYYNSPYRIGGFAGTIHSSIINGCFANANLKILDTAKNVGAFSGTGEFSDFISCIYSKAKTGNWDIVDYYFSPQDAHDATYVMNPV